MIGLPQGSVLIPLFFNVVMSSVAPASLISGVQISSTIYVDDLGLWAANTRVYDLRKAVQSALNVMIAQLESVGLHVAA